MATEAPEHVLQLAGLLKRPAVAALPGAVAIVAVKAAGALAALRPQHAGRVLPTLLALAEPAARPAAAASLRRRAVRRVR